MKIFRYEMKKLLICPFLLGLFAIFTVFNIVILIDDLSPKYSNYEGIYPAIVGDENAEKGAADYYENFYSELSGIYNNLDMNEIFNHKIALYYSELSADGAYYKWMQKNYAELQARVENIRNSEEAGGDFYPGPAYEIHKKLCGLISRSLLESLILGALTVLYLMDYERINAAEDVIYPTKCGKKVQLIKFAAGAVFSLFCAAILFALPLGIFAAEVPMKGLWGTSLSAFMLTEPTAFFAYPFVTWAKMSVLGQLSASLGLCAALILIVLGFCAGAYFFLRNSYFVMLGAAVAFLGMLLLPYAVPAGVWHTLSLMSPAVLFDSAGMWFIEFDPARGKYFELATIAIWTAVAAGAVKLGWRRFGR